MGETQREDHEACESGALRQCFRYFLSENGERPRLQQGVISVRLARIYPYYVEEQSPGHPARTRPNQPERNDNHNNADRGVREEHNSLLRVKRSRDGFEIDRFCWAAGVRQDCESDLAALQGEMRAAQSAENREQAGALRSIDRSAPHSLEVYAVTWNDAG